MQSQYAPSDVDCIIIGHLCQAGRITPRLERSLPIISIRIKCNFHARGLARPYLQLYRRAKKKPRRVVRPARLSFTSTDRAKWLFVFVSFGGSCRQGFNPAHIQQTFKGASDHAVQSLQDGEFFFQVLDRGHHLVRLIQIKVSLSLPM